MRITLAQMEITNKIEKNLEKILQVIEKANGKVIFFPELALTGYQSFDSQINSLVEEALKEIQKKAKDKLILLGAPNYQGKNLYNAYYLITSEGYQIFAEKEVLFPGLDDVSGFSSGQRRHLLHFNHSKWGIVICFELRSPEAVRSWLREGIDGLVVPALWPESRIEHFQTLLKARAIENQIFVIGINGVGKIGNFHLGGCSSVIDPYGTSLLTLKDEEELGEITLDLEYPSLPYPLKTPLFKTSKLKSLAELLEITKKRREKGQIMVFTNGCFDILHAGHVDYLQKARKLGDFLVLGLNSDLSISKLKGPSRPVNTQDLRIEVLSALEYVDYIILFDEETPENLIKALKPDILVKGADWKEEEIVGADFVKSYGGKVVRIEFSYDISTTKIIEKIRNLKPAQKEEFLS